MGFPRQGYWSGLPGDLGIKLVSSALVGEFFTTEQPGKHQEDCVINEGLDF